MFKAPSSAATESTRLLDYNTQYVSVITLVESIVDEFNKLSREVEVELLRLKSKSPAEGYRFRPVAASPELFTQEKALERLAGIENSAEEAKRKLKIFHKKLIKQSESENIEECAAKLSLLEQLIQTRIPTFKKDKINGLLTTKEEQARTISNAEDEEEPKSRRPTYVSRKTLSWFMAKRDEESARYRRYEIRSSFSKLLDWLFSPENAKGPWYDRVGGLFHGAGLSTTFSLEDSDSPQITYDLTRSMFQDMLVIFTSLLTAGLVTAGITQSLIPERDRFGNLPPDFPAYLSNLNAANWNFISNGALIIAWVISAGIAIVVSTLQSKIFSNAFSRELAKKCDSYNEANDWAGFNTHVGLRFLEGALTIAVNNLYIVSQKKDTLDEHSFMIWNWLGIFLMSIVVRLTYMSGGVIGVGIYALIDGLGKCMGYRNSQSPSQIAPVRADYDEIPGGHEGDSDDETLVLGCFPTGETIHGGPRRIVATGLGNTSSIQRMPSDGQFISNSANANRAGPASEPAQILGSSPP